VEICIICVCCIVSKAILVNFWRQLLHYFHLYCICGLFLRLFVVLEDWFVCLCWGCIHVDVCELVVDEEVHRYA
jgi:hypothetical protein